MAKKSVVARNKKREELVARYAKKHAELKKTVRTAASYDERMAALEALQKLPRDANPTRVRKRCLITGRPRAVMSRFGISRIKLRELLMRGEIPGVEKSSW
jgi:small subunit ribosomal protein S14